MSDLSVLFCCITCVVCVTSVMKSWRYAVDHNEKHSVLERDYEELTEKYKNLSEEFNGYCKRTAFKPLADIDERAVQK